MFGGPLRVLEIFGDSSDLGRGHGSSCSQMIQKYLDDRMTLTAQEEWGGKIVDRDLILELAEGTLEHHERFSESLFVEMVTMGKAADITPAEAVVVGGFTDLVDVIRTRVGSAPAEHNCTAVINPQAGFYAQTWDMHASAGEFVVMLKLDPLIGPDVLVQTTAGCLGQMGMNEAGISVGINNLTAMGKPGVTWPFVVRKVLEQTDLESAIDVVVEAPLAGGHNFGVMGPDGHGANIEAMPNGCKVTPVSQSPFVHSNHCLHPSTADEEGDRLLEYIDNSIRRLQIGTENASDPERFFADAGISRSVEGTHDVGTCGAVIIEPARRVMRAVWGVPGEHPWETFTL